MDTMSKIDAVRAACCVAAADGEISVEERQLIDAIANEVGIGKVSLDAMIDRAVSDPQFYEEQFGLLNSNPQESLKLLFGTALIDGELSDEECQVLRKLSQRLQISRATFDRMLDEAERYLEGQASDDDSLYLSS